MRYSILSLCIGIFLLAGYGKISFASEYGNSRIDVEKMIVMVPEKEWTAVAEILKINPASPCAFVSLARKIFIKKGSYVHSYTHIGSFSHGLRQTYKEYCLYDEVDYLREYVRKIKD